jgi:hypothetical protein
MAEAWDSGTRAAVQRIPLLTVREMREGKRESGDEAGQDDGDARERV